MFDRSHLIVGAFAVAVLFPSLSVGQCMSGRNAGRSTGGGGSMTAITSGRISAPGLSSMTPAYLQRQQLPNQSLTTQPQLQQQQALQMLLVQQQLQQQQALLVQQQVAMQTMQLQVAQLPIAVLQQALQSPNILLRNAANLELAKRQNQQALNLQGAKNPGQ